ncbi:MAG TPA: site-2 protease family protein [Ktedonobacteraceae bacterium]|nr:site-2 protease family protein [Ktedonobacteraceae bacterium]
MTGSLRLGKIAGIDIYAHLSWFIILVLLTWSLASDWFAQLFPGWATTTYWITAFISALLLFACVLVHELTHALVSQAHGLTVKNITLFIFGGVANIEEEVKRPGIEFQIAAVGPIASLLLAAVTFLLALPLRGSNSSAEAILDYLAVSNLVLGVFNLIPGFPLDGGRVLRSIIWKVTGNLQKSTRIASYVGQASAYVFILLGIIEFFTGNFFNGLWTVFVGWFLLNASQTANTQVELQSTLQGVSVGQVMNPRPVTVPGNISLQRLMDEYFLPLGLHSAPVTQGDYLSGLITFTDIAGVARERWSYIPVGHVMRLLEQVYTTTPEQPLQDVLKMMGTQDINQVPVIQDGRLVGLLSRESIIRYLQVRQSLKGDEPQFTA